MAFLHNLKLWLSPPRILDPDFGDLVFIYISKWPERSYWEAEWKFPPTGTVVAIALRGGEAGPDSETRQFYLNLLSRYDAILRACRPELERVFRTWRNAQLPENIFGVVKLTGFGVEDPAEQPVRWDISFETTDDNWLGISIPFVGETAQEAMVDT